MLRTGFNIVAAVIAVFGFGLEMEGQHLYLGIFFMILSLGYGGWELFTSKAAINRFPFSVRVVFLVALALIIALVSWPHILEMTSPHEVAKGHNRQRMVEQKPIEPKPESKPSPEILKKPKIKPVKNPLEIVAFRSDYGISIANNGPLSIHVLSLIVKGYEETKSFALGLDVAPGKIAELKIQWERFHHVRTLFRLADTWGNHVRKAKELYSACGIQWTFFAPSDVSLQQIKDLYTKQNEVLGYEEVSSILYYRVEGLTKTEEQVMPVVETITLNDDSCPKYVRPLAVP